MSLFHIENKVLNGKRLNAGDALTLFQSDDIFTIGRLASHVAVQKNGNNAYFIQNHHINPTNICVNRCRFCAFSRSQGESGAYELSIKEIIAKLKKQESRVNRLQQRRGDKNQTRDSRLPTQLSEVHIVGGLHPDWSFDHYLNMLSEIRKHFPRLHIKAFTAVEIDHFTRISGLSLADTITMLKNAGIDSIPGGGAEIFSGRVRNQICPEKIPGRTWLKIMEAAHTAGIKSNATMLYGHIEGFQHRVDHLVKLRDLQDRTMGFQAFIPLAFHPVNTELGVGQGSGIDDLKTIAVSRLFLDNFPHIKAYWIMLGEKIAQLALLFGADDLDGTIMEEKITHSAGGMTGEAMTREELRNLIRKAGRVPIERDSYYQSIEKLP